MEYSKYIDVLLTLYTNDVLAYSVYKYNIVTIVTYSNINGLRWLLNSYTLVTAYLFLVTKLSFLHLIL